MTNLLGVATKLAMATELFHDESWSVKNGIPRSWIMIIIGDYKGSCLSPNLQIIVVVDLLG